MINSSYGRQMNEAISFISGMVVMCFIAWAIIHSEWENRRQLERRVNELYRHLSCGAGILGCNGGPKCTSDHK